MYTNSVLILFTVTVHLLSLVATEMVEHDIAPEEERETVVEEPHTTKKEEEEKEEVREKEKEDDGVESKSEETSAKGDEDQPYAGVTTFFSGIASIVQTTVNYTSFT